MLQSTVRCAAFCLTALCALLAWSGQTMHFFHLTCWETPCECAYLPGEVQQPGKRLVWVRGVRVLRFRVRACLRSFTVPLSWPKTLGALLGSCHVGMMPF
jgi:hypothetical protein